MTTGVDAHDGRRGPRAPLEAVIFDWGGTLTPWHVIEPLEAWHLAAGDPEVAARLLAAENAVWIRSRDEHRSGHLDEILATAGVKLDDTARRAYHDWWEPHTYLDPAAPAVFRGLRERGLRIGVLSNTVWPRAEHERIFARDDALDLIDGAVYTSEIEWTKPHPEAFRAAMAAVDVEDPARCVFVGDRLFDDIHGAKSIGMRAVFVPHSTIPDTQRGHTDGEPDAVIESLADLLPVIDGWLRPR